MRVSLPVSVMLRCRDFANVEQCVQGTIGPFTLQGRRDDGSHEMWAPDGHWREDRTPHPCDIVGLIASDGSVVPLTNHFEK